MYAFRAARRGTLLSLLACMSLAGCSAVAHLTGRFESPSVELDASKVESISLTTAHLRFEFVVHNPNPYAVRSHTLRYRMTVADAQVAEGRVDATHTFPGESATTLLLPVDVGFGTLSTAAPQAMAFGEVPYELEIWLSLRSWMHEREVHLTTPSVLRLNLPLGLAGGTPIAFPASPWQS